MKHAQVHMPPHHACSEGKQHEARASSDASTVPMFSRRTSSATEQREDTASSDPDVAHVMLILHLFDLRLHSHNEASASSAHDDHADSPRQHAATQHRDLATSCTTSASADDFVRTPLNENVRSMFDLMNASCDPASHRGAWGNLEENVVARNILRTAAIGAKTVGWGTRCQWLCPLTADEWLTRALGHRYLHDAEA